jgi:serine protease Do
MYEPYDPNTIETSSGDPIEEASLASSPPTGTDAVGTPPTSRPASDAAVSAPRRERSPHLRVNKAVAALALVLVVLVSSLAGFGGGLLATGLLSTAPTVTAAPTDVPTDGASPTSSATATPAADPTGSALTNATGTGATTGLTVAGIAAKAGPSVVVINTTSTVVVRGRTYTVQGAGSGVILTSDGYIVTNNHVVDGATRIEVVLSDGTTFDATVIGTDAQADIAVVKVDQPDLVAVTVGSSDTLVVGDAAVAIGNPLGELGGTVTEGIISSLSREIDLDGHTMDLLQTDAAINPGNSGGGLFNAAGNLIGIVVAKSSGSNLEGLGFAIPIDHVRALIEGYIATGRAGT